MDVRINTDATAEPISMEEIMDFLKFEDTDLGEEQALIQQMLIAARSHFEKRTGLAFAPKTYEAFFLQQDAPFVLPVSPVISVDKVEVVNYLEEKTELTLNTDYYKRGLYEVEILPTGFTYDSDCLLVTFQAGYGSLTTQTLPADLREAMKMQIKRWYDNRDDFYEYKILGSIERILQLHKMKVI